MEWERGVLYMYRTAELNTKSLVQCTQRAPRPFVAGTINSFTSTDGIHQLNMAEHKRRLNLVTADIAPPVVVVGLQHNRRVSMVSQCIGYLDVPARNLITAGQLTAPAPTRDQHGCPALLKLDLASNKHDTVPISGCIRANAKGNVFTLTLLSLLTGGFLG